MRFGQSITCLPDGRVVQIGGEHEDYYDPDFCIYNDVFVHGSEGSIAIFGYPEAVFPPTDFHTATLVDGAIYLIDSLGYVGTRRYGQTPVHRLDVGTYRMERQDASGEQPGWIYGPEPCAWARARSASRAARSSPRTAGRKFTRTTSMRSCSTSSACSGDGSAKSCCAPARGERNAR
jgi:hypothetical protein